jgi:hypothetical protein
MTYNLDDVNSWPGFRPLIIAHDVGRSDDRSTAVVGGNNPYGRRVLGIREAEELPQNLFGHRRASALAAVDQRCGRNALIVADLSNDATYAEVLYDTFGPRVIGLRSVVMVMVRPLSAGSSNVAICQSIPLAEPICSNCSIPNCRMIKCDFLTGPGHATPMNSSQIWRLSFVTAERSIAARQVYTMTSAYPARCWRGRPGIPIWLAG